MTNDKLVCALLISFAFFAQGADAAEKINIKSACYGHDWKMVFTNKGCPYRVNADGTRTILPFTQPNFGAFEVKLVGDKFEIVDTIWGNPPKSNAFELGSLHHIMMGVTSDEVMESYFNAPRLDTPIKWKHKNDDWLEIIHQASLDKKALKKLRKAKDLSRTHFIVIVYFNNDETRWHFNLQTICDFLLVENNRVYAPIFLKEPKPGKVWAYHPLESHLPAFKKLIKKTAYETIDQRPAKCE